MELPKLDIAALPQLDVATGIHGSTGKGSGALTVANDTIIILMVYVYR